MKGTICIHNRVRLTERARGLIAQAGLRVQEVAAKEWEKGPEGWVWLVDITVPVTRAMVERVPELGYVLTGSVGVDHIDLAACEEWGVEVINANGSNSDSVAEQVLGMMIGLGRNWWNESKRLQEGKWKSQGYVGTELAGHAIGLVGCGAIGTLVAKKLRSLGIKEIRGYDPFMSREELWGRGIEKATLEEVLSQSDMISVQVPLNENTRHLLAKREFERMKPGTKLVNVSRGGVVDEEDLRAQLRRGRLRAAIDVFENEPDINSEWKTTPNVFITPHIAAYTNTAVAQMVEVPILRWLEQWSSKQKSKRKERQTEKLKTSIPPSKLAGSV